MGRGKIYKKLRSQTVKKLLKWMSMKSLPLRTTKTKKFSKTHTALSSKMDLFYIKWHSPTKKFGIDCYVKRVGGCTMCATVHRKIYKKSSRSPPVEYQRQYP